MKKRKQQKKSKISNKKGKYLSEENMFSKIKPIRIKILLIVILILFFLLIARLFYFQFYESSYLSERASRQQTINRTIAAKRGTIYDSKGQVLAKSASVDTITINPKSIVDDKGDEQKTLEKKTKVATAISEIFELDYSEVFDKVNSTASVETIIKKVEHEKVDELKTWMTENKITAGININEDSKRYYPYENLASNLIGFCGTDGNGLEGLEAKWDTILSGIPRKNHYTC